MSYMRSCICDARRDAYSMQPQKGTQRAGKTAPDGKLIVAKLDGREFGSLDTQWWKERSDFHKSLTFTPPNTLNSSKKHKNTIKHLKETPLGKMGIRLEISFWGGVGLLTGSLASSYPDVSIVQTHQTAQQTLHNKLKEI